MDTVRRPARDFGGPSSRPAPRTSVSDLREQSRYRSTRKRHSVGIGKLSRFGDGSCRIALFWIKAPRVAGTVTGPAVSRPACLPAAGRKAACRAAIRAPRCSSMTKSKGTFRRSVGVRTVAPADTDRCAPCHLRGTRADASGGDLRLRHGWTVPPTTDPGKPSRPPSGPPASVGTAAGRRQVAAPVTARSPGGRVDSRRNGPRTRGVQGRYNVYPVFGLRWLTVTGCRLCGSGTSR
jgi:hypothetical protein